MKALQTYGCVLLLIAVSNLAGCNAKEPVGGGGQAKTASGADIHILKCSPQAGEDSIIREKGAQVTWRSWDKEYKITFDKKSDKNGNDITPPPLDVAAQKTKSWDTSSASFDCDDVVTGSIKSCYFKYKVSVVGKDCKDPGVHIIPGSFEGVN